VLGVIEGEVERHVGVVDVDIDELHDVLVRNLPQQLQEKRSERKSKLKVEGSGNKWYHDFSDGGGGDAVPVLRLLELLDGDGFGGRRGFGSCQKN